ncbi:MAG TPA: GNAT family N-acetyltransferase [Edaphobacter sp.]|jgi:ribosomal-protein-alanine N-acetyltransferase|nr:GNAT family N-acetyltransferase [Edaphobacter sp.]
MNISGFRIRAAQKADLVKIVAMERSIAEAPHWSENEYAAMLGDNQNTENLLKRCLLVAEDMGKDRLLGFTVGKMIWLAYESIAELESIVVNEATRRQGVGRVLCEAVIAWSRKQGVLALELEVRTGNQAAIALYSSLGFKITGSRRGYYQEPVEDAVLMRLDLEKGF